MSKLLYGSLENRIMERSVTPQPEIGMGVTEYLWSDRHAYEIVAIKDEKHLTIRRLKATMKPGTDWLDQEYDYASDQAAPTINIVKTKKGGWRERIGSHGLGCNRFGIGVASEYRDPSF